MRIVDMDIPRVAAEIVALCAGELLKLGRVPMLRDKLEAFARKELTHDDHVVIEATGNATSVAELLAPFVDRVIVANPKQVRMIAHAKIKTDAIDAAVLAKLYATGFLPEVWVPVARTLALRRQVARRTQLVRQRVRQRVRLKNMIQSILHEGTILPYRTFDTLRSVHRSPVVENKRLDDILSIVAEMQDGREQQRRRQHGPSRQGQKDHMFGIPDGSVSNGYQKRGRKPGRRTDFTNDPEVIAKRKKALARMEAAE